MIPTEILKKVRLIQLRTNRVVTDALAGEYQSAFKGRGMEFEEVREYQAGDDVRTIDWNVTARAGSPFVKKFREERELTVMLAVDVSSSGRFGTTPLTKGELAAELCAVVAFSATLSNDKVGLILFTDEIEKFVPPKKGRTHVLRVIRELLYHRPERRKTDINLALEYLLKVQKRRAVVFLVSDFLAEDYSKTLSLAARRHDIISVSLTDPRESELPPVGLIELEDAETGERVVVDTSSRAVRDAFSSSWGRERQGRSETFRRSGVDDLLVRTDRSYVESLRRLFHERERAIR